MEKKVEKLHIKNMVCPRCVLSVEQILDKLAIPYVQVIPGEALLKKALSETETKTVESELKKVGFELIETRLHRIIEDIRLLVIAYVNQGPEKKENLSSFITDRLPYDYSYLSDLFSSTEGISIEQLFISRRIERVKELIVYDQLSLTEIAHQTGFSSVHHLSAQFKKNTGLTPTYFKRIGASRK